MSEGERKPFNALTERGKRKRIAAIKKKKCKSLKRERINLEQNSCQPTTSFQKPNANHKHLPQSPELPHCFSQDNLPFEESEKLGQHHEGSNLNKVSSDGEGFQFLGDYCGKVSNLLSDKGNVPLSGEDCSEKQGNSGSESEYDDSLSESDSEPAENSLSDCESGTRGSSSTAGIDASILDEEFQNYHNVAQAENSMNSFLRLLLSWAVLFKIPLNALSALLKILRLLPSMINILPADARTFLMDKPCSAGMRKMGIGEYYHFGIRSRIQRELKSIPKSVKTLHLVLNIDGLPLFKSATNQLWPILFSVNEIPLLVFCAGIYEGVTKPENVDEFLKEFIEDLTDILKNGVRSDNRRFFKVKLFCVTCDAPAKAYLLGCKNFNGYSSCTRCIQRGKSIGRTMTFAKIFCRKRTHESFINRSNPPFHLRKSPFEDVPGINMVATFALDYMHLVCLGVVRTIFKTWVFGKVPFKLSALLIAQISCALLAVRPYLPSEFCRKPRHLTLIKRFKATELRQLLLYTGPVVLKGYLGPNKYKNFLALCVAMRILLSPRLRSQPGFCKYARNLLVFFVRCFKVLYSPKFLTHNFHNLVHLPDDIETFGSLDCASAFRFENFLQFLKSLVRKPFLILPQVVRRIEEVAHCEYSRKDLATACSTKVKNCKSKEPKSFRANGFKVSPGKKDSCVGLVNGSIVVVEDISHSSNGVDLVVIGREFLEKTDFFMDPCPSSLVGIHRVSKLSCLNTWSVSAIDKKYVLLPHKSEFIALSLLHCDS